MATYPEEDVEHTGPPRPDVVLKEDERLLGVEIVEVYRSAAAARLHNIPDYNAKILAGDKPKRPDEPFLIAVTLPDGSSAIMQRVEPGERPAKVAEAIRNKTRKSYDVSGLDRINLIVLDGLDLPFDPWGDQDLADVLTDELREALLASPFDEVYLVLRCEGQVEHVYVPLRQLLVLDYWARWRWAFAHLKGLVLSAPYAVESFGTYLATMSDQFVMADVEGEAMPCCRSYGFSLLPTYPDFHVIDLRDRTVVEREPMPVFDPKSMEKLIEKAGQARMPIHPEMVTPAQHPLWEDRGGNAAGQSGR